jgi:hypothetical protein
VVCARPYRLPVGFSGVLRRYVPAEITGTLAACAGAWLAYRMHASPYAAGLAASLCEAVGYYAVILFGEARRLGNVRALPRVLPGLMVEFGPAELADTLIARPLLMAAGPLLLAGPLFAGPLFAGTMAGTLAGKVAADLLFYAVVLPSSRLRRRLFPVRVTVLALSARAASDAGSPRRSA